MTVPRLAGVVVLGAAVLAGTSARCEEQATPEPERYRNEDYRAPTPSTLRGARVITTAQAEVLWRAGTAVFVDVMPHVLRPAGLPAGTFWRGKPRYNIPGSIWLADTGHGELTASTEGYLKAGLERITGGDRGRLVVIYCQRDCWMSWNAAKRAVALGYTAVAWYPDGSDGWQDAGLPLSEATPAPPPRE
jgi:PQQ-dependent catabolism-associated CXXCW motif protein